MNVTQARDAMMLVVRTALAADPLTTAIPIIYDDVPQDPPGNDANGNPLPYFLVFASHTGGGRDTLGGPGLGQCQHQGEITIRALAAKGFGRSNVDKMAQVAKRAIQEKAFGTNGWFFGARVLEIPDPKHARADVVAGFRYQETLGE